MRRIIFYAVAVSCMLVYSCSDNSLNLPDHDPRLRFLGSYHMTKLEDGGHYVLNIGAVGDYCHECDSLEILNLGDMFNIRFTNFTEVYHDSLLNYLYFNPIRDNKNGYRWRLSRSGSVYPPANNNVKYGDSLKLRFKITNGDYFIEDGVPFRDTILTHVGVRI